MKVHWHRAWLARLMAATLLFGQTIAISQACASADASPTMAFSESMAGHDCEGATNPAPNPNACLEHCNQGDQASVYVPAVVATLSTIAVLVVPMPGVTVRGARGAPACEPHSPDPPRSIRFCSYQL